MTTARQEAEQELAYAVGKERAAALMDAATAETFRIAADAMTAMSNEDGSNLLRSIAECVAEPAPGARCGRMTHWGRCVQPSGHDGAHLYPTPATPGVIR
jgi:hypothetical protein